MPKPGELIIPEMSDNIDEITDWNVYPTYDAYVSMMMQFAVELSINLQADRCR
ncbi:MAG: hypothetical protein MZV64_52500 [Ignavibacteriales bacterium]|nr:hypothetical protein [Ignavibacteriales bacterium]